MWYDLSIVKRGDRVPSLTRKTIAGHEYYYLRECRRVDGKPKIVWTAYLGTAKALVERLLRPRPEPPEIFEFGASAALYDVARELDVVGIIDRHIPKKSSGPSVGQYLLLAALNRCVAPASKSKLARWYGGSVLRRLLGLEPRQLTSQRFWDNMDRVTEEALGRIDRDLAQAAVTRFGLDLRCLLFDATNFFTFIDSFNTRSTLAQRGHSKEGRDNLRIIGLALLVTSDGEVPLLHQTYAGNRPDAPTFASVVDELAARCQQLTRGAVDVTLVFDKGNNSQENLQQLQEHLKSKPLHFVGSLVPTQHPDLLKIRREQMKRLDRSQLPAVWAYRTRRKVFGVDRTVLVTFNQPLFRAQQKTLEREIRKRKRRLQELETSLERYARNPRGPARTVDTVRRRIEAILKARHMKDLFATTVRAGRGGRPRLQWRFRLSAWEDLARTLLGKTILFTDREDWTDEQIVRAYRSQSHVELAFRRMKDPHFLTFRPTHHWTDQKLRVHAFYCVVALTLASLLRRKLARAGLDMSIATMIESLSGIREVALLYRTGEGLPGFRRTTLSRLDRVQRTLVRLLDLQRYCEK